MSSPSPDTTSTKKRKAKGDDPVLPAPPPPTSMWLLSYQCEFDGLMIEHALFSSKELAIAGLPAFMDKYCIIGTEWRHGLQGFGKEDEESMNFEVLDVGNEGGVLLRNDTESSGEEPEVVYLRRIKVDQYA